MRMLIHNPDEVLSVITEMGGLAVEQVSYGRDLYIELINANIEEFRHKIKNNEIT